MTKIAIYTLTSELHDEQAVDALTKEFLANIRADYDFCGSDYSSYGTRDLNLIYVRTGGTEGVFKRLLPELQARSSQPFYLLTSGQSNSLAASMEILSFLQQQGLSGEIIHGQADYVSKRIALLAKVESARKMLRGSRLGVIGQPSDWLISSIADREKIRAALGIEIVDIAMPELLDEIAATPLNAQVPLPAPTEKIRQALPGALQIYDALTNIVKRHNLQGFTLRCFDLLTAVRNTGCLALAKLNAEGIVAGCEGDIPAMLTMAVAKAVTGVTGFQANPAQINAETGELLFAHCTIPLNIIERYELDTHFESGIGVGIRGFMKEGPVTVAKLAGDLSRSFIEEGMLMRNQAQPDLCRTQQVIKLSATDAARYFLTNPIGNHHIILPGHHKEALEELVGSSL